jgi:DHA2 family multidrug resistance protein-like MFS transporter
LLPLYLARGRGFSTTQIGILLGLQSAARAIAAPVSGRMSDRFGTGMLIGPGMVSLASALFLLHAFGDGTAPIAIGGALTLLGVAAGLFVPANSKVLLCASPVEKYGVSTGVLGTARNAGMTLGVALAAMLYSGFGGDNSAPNVLYAVREALAVVAAIATLYAAVGIPLHAAETVNNLKERII